MKLNKEDYYNLVSDLLSKTEFENRIAKHSEKFDNLINDDVVAHLIIDELNRNVTEFSNLSKIRPNTRISLFVTVTTPEPKLFKKKKDKHSGADIRISDHSGSGRLILWDSQHVEQVENGNIKPGTKLKILNAKVIRSDYGLDISPDRFESLIINPVDFPDEEEINALSELMDINAVDDDGPVNVGGTISWKNQIRSFNRKDKSTGYVLNLEIFDGTGTIRITLWDDQAKAAKEYEIGDLIKILNGYSKMHNGVREIQSNYRTQIIKENEK
jgi:replication factor A1